MMDFSDVLITVIGIVSVVYFYVKWKYTFWARKGLENPKTSFLVGNAADIVTRKGTFGDTITSIYRDMKNKGLKHAGMYLFLSPVYIPIDPELVKHIMQRDFQHFTDRGIYFNENDDPLSAHLFSLEGQKWKSLRAKLTPTFTSGKMKNMFPIVLDTTKQLVEVLDKDGLDGSLEIKDYLARLTTDVIGSCAFGIDCNSLKDPDTEFRRHGKRVFQDTPMDQVRGFLSFMYPKLMKFCRLKIVPEEVTEFFTNLVEETIKYRQDNNINRKDFMYLLLQLRNKGKLDDDDDSATKSGEANALTFNEVVAQAFAIFLGGFETASTTMSFCLYELAIQQDVQGKLRAEVDEVFGKHGGQLTYDALAELTYMDKVIAETLRKYPPLPLLFRLCTKDYDVPHQNFRLPKGTAVFIPVGGLQADEEFYPKPDVFDPERFTEENKSKRHSYTYLPFGEGPRICIGMRFGVMQTKVGLSVLLKHYQFTLGSKTPVPLKMDPTSFLNSALGGIWMDLRKIATSN